MRAGICWCFVFLVASCSTPAGAACSRDDAFNKMMALSQYGMKLQAALPDPLKDAAGYNANYKRVIDFNTRLGDVGKTLAAQQYDQACATYDALAAEYHVDVAGQHVRPLSELEAEFIAVAASYSQSKGIDYATWRKVGVAADTLSKAGIKR